MTEYPQRLEACGDKERSMSNPSRPPLRYHGGKWRLGQWIISHFPEHRIYVEPFGGGASVLIQKARSYAEVYNDLDGEVVNFFRVLQDPQKAARLKDLLSVTPFARAEFERAYEPTDDDVEGARRLLIRSHMGFGSAAISTKHRTGFRSNAHRSGTTPAHDWINYRKLLSSFTERLQSVVIENRDASEVMLQHDGPDTLHYCDPPYVHSTRYVSAKRANCYRYEMTDDDHRKLADVLRSLTGMVILSGYACDLYDLELYPDWMRVECSTIASSNNASVSQTEVLWLNPAAASKQSQLHLFDAETA